MNENQFLQLLQHPLKSRFFLLKRLPAAFFSGVRIKYVDETKALVTVPYSWFSKNPFKSTYFACLAMAAEMSTGLLALLHIYRKEPPVSMLVIKMEAAYFKKATGITAFFCEDGAALKQTIDEAVATGEAGTFTARSVGKNAEGEVVAEFLITWSFKARVNK